MEDIEDILICILCKKISETPMTTNCCGSIVCADCRDKTSPKECPSCKNHNYQIVVNKFLSKLSSQIKSQVRISCPYSCGYMGDAVLVAEHELICPSRSIDCTECQFSSGRDEFICHINEKHADLLLTRFFKKKSPKQTELQSPIWDLFSPKINSAGNQSQFGENQKYYCGKSIGFKCGCCDGICGPTNGDNCPSCMVLDIKARNLPKGFLVNKFGIVAILKQERFQCGVLLSKGENCGQKTCCQGCQSLTRNQQHYKQAFQ